MSRLQIGVVRYASVATAIGRALGVEPAPYCRIGQGRITLTFRHLGASRWSENRQIEHALRAAATARAVLADDPRRTVRERATRDRGCLRGCHPRSGLLGGSAVGVRSACV